MESLELNSSLFLLSEQKKEGGRGGGGGGGGGGGVALLGTLRSIFELLYQPGQSYVPISRVPSNPEEAAPLPLGSYSSYRLLGKMY